MRQKPLITTLLILTLTLVLPSCMTRKRVNYLQEGTHIPQYDSTSYEEYRLQRGDYLYISVHSMVQEDEMLFNGAHGTTRLNLNNLSADNASYRLFLYLVEEDGAIEYPYVGRVPVLDKTVREVKYILEDSLKSMMRNFSVDIRLSNRTFSVIGEAGSGRYSIPKEKMTIFQALAMSGDLSTYSDRTKVRLLRQTPTGTIVKEFDLRARSIINSEFYYIQPNDVIYVQFDKSKNIGQTSLTSALSLTISTASLIMLVPKIIQRIQKANHPQSK